MREVLQNIDGLVTLLEQKLKATEVLNKQLSMKKLDSETVLNKALAKLKNASAMERIYKKYVDFDTEKKKFEASRTGYSDKLSKLEKIAHENDVVLQSIREEQKALDERKVVLNKQATGLKERTAKFDKDKADLKALVSGETLKGMFK